MQTSNDPVLPRRRWLAAAAAIVALGGLAGAAPAQAELGIDSFSTSFTDPVGSVQTQAGQHDDFTTSFRLATKTSATGKVVTDEQLREFALDLPAGFYGNPQAVPRCAPGDFGDTFKTCPVDSQVGVATVVTTADGLGRQTPVYNIQTAPGQTAILAFQVLNVNVEIDVGTRPENNHALRARSRNVNTGLQVYGVDLTLWGVPSDSSHDDLRYPFGQVGGPQTTPSGAPKRPFLSSPSRCDGPLVSRVSMRSWQNPDRWVTGESSSPTRTDCDQLRFDPSLDVEAGDGHAGAPSAYTVDLRVPQDETVAGVATPQLRDATVTMPEGVAISPSSADGLGACSDEQLAQTSPDPEQCPSNAKIGTVTIDTPILATPLQGSIYFGTQQSSDPQSGEMYRMFLVAEGSGVRLKLKGAIKADPVTGQLTTTFADNPQLPFTRLRLQFMGGNRAPLVNPTSCGTKTATGALRSWDGETQDASSSFAIDQGCPFGQFEPSFSAGTANPLAGAFSSFTMTVSRSDADQELSQIALRLPPGLLASLGSVPLCPEAQAAAGSCGAESQVGTTTVSAGPGSNPFSLPGKVFLAGPYKGAPFSLSIVVPAKAGPIDLGTVVVRSQLLVDAAHARAEAPADPLPTILGGIPLKIRTINISLDRPGFMFNATNCTPMAIGASLTSTNGAVADMSSRYQAQGCAGLKLDPKLDLKLTGKAEMKKGGHPGVSADLTQTFGQSGLKQVKVVLPLSVALAADNAEGLCTPAQAAARSCPSTSIVGNASARTPALHEALSGPVYFVEGTRRGSSGQIIKTLPKLWLKLEGEGVPLDLWADSEVVGPQGGQHLVTTFSSVPDAPISSFRLAINGGKHGILAATKYVCAADRGTPVTFDGQNGARVTQNLSVGLPDCGLRISTATVTSTSIKARVTGIGAGKVSVSGKGGSRSTRTIGSATAATVTFKLSKATRSAVARGRKVKVKLTATFTPKGSKKAQKTTKTITVKKTKVRGR